MNSKVSCVRWRPFLILPGSISVVDLFLAVSCDFSTTSFIRCREKVSVYVVRVAMYVKYPKATSRSSFAALLRLF